MSKLGLKEQVKKGLVSIDNALKIMHESNTRDWLLRRKARLSKDKKVTDE